MTQLMWPSQGLHNIRRLDKYKWLSPSQGSMAIASVNVTNIEGLGNGGTIEYNAPIPDLVEDFVTSGKSFVLDNITVGLEGLQISKGSEDGKFMYCYDVGNNDILQYNFGTPYDLDTVVNSAHGFSVPLGSSGIEFDFEFSGTGTLLYFIIFASSKFRLNSENLFVPWQLIDGDANSEQNFDFDTLPVISISFSTDGLTLFALVGSMPVGSIRQYNLLAPFMVKNMVDSGTIFNLPSGLPVRNIRLLPDGLNVYVSATNETVHRFELATPNDLSTISTTVDGILNVSASLNDLEGIAVSSNATKLFVVDQQIFKVIEWIAPTTQGPIEVVVP